jgi:hypothetical protein
MSLIAIFIIAAMWMLASGMRLDTLAPVFMEALGVGA